MHNLFIDHCNNKLIIGTQKNYRQDPRMVEIFGGNVVYSRPCIGDLKGWKTLFAYHFYSEGFAGLRAALCIFLDSHERLFLCLLAPWLEFVVVVDLLLNLRI